MPRTSTSAKIQSAVAAAIAAKEAELVATATKPEKKYIGKASFHVEGLLMADANIIFTESQFNGGEISLVTIRPSTMAADAKLQVAAITKKDANTVVMSENEITAVLGAAGALSYYGAAVINGKPSTWLHLIKDPKMTVADSDFAGAVNTNMWDEMADADGVLRFTTPLTGKIVSEISRPAFPGWWGLRIVENRIKVVEMTAERGAGIPPAHRILCVQEGRQGSEPHGRQGIATPRAPGYDRCGSGEVQTRVLRQSRCAPAGAPPDPDRHCPWARERCPEG